jgi:hypothetical protein
MTDKTKAGWLAAIAVLAGIGALIIQFSTYHGYRITLINSACSTSLGSLAQAGSYQVAQGCGRASDLIDLRDLLFAMFAGFSLALIAWRARARHLPVPVQGHSDGIR